MGTTIESDWENARLHEELAAARAEIERMMSAGQFVLEQLAAEQANNAMLRSTAKAVIDRWETPLWKDAEPTATVINALRKALSTPYDTSALETMIAKAGEAMREKCLSAASDVYGELSTHDAIHTLPGVTLEDLK